MKTIIVAFWEKNPGSGKDSDDFLLAPGVIPIFKQGRAFPLIFNEKAFLEKKKKSKEDRLSFIFTSIKKIFLSVEYKTVIVALSEDLRVDFFEMIKYLDWPDPFPSIPGEQFGQEDRIFVFLQDKSALGDSPARITMDPTSKDPKAFRLVRKINVHFPN